MYDYYLEADTVGNPDFRQDPTQELWGVPPLRMWAEPKDFKRLLREWIGENDIGGGNLSNARILRKTKDETEWKHYLDISYNGRLWEPGDVLSDRVEYVPNEDNTFTKYQPISRETRNKIVSKLKEQKAPDLSKESITKALRGAVCATGLIRTALRLVKTREINTWDLASG